MGDFLPFSERQFFDVFVALNTSYGWAVPLCYAGGIGALYVLGERAKALAWALPAVLAALWFANAGLYHFMHFAPINPLAYGFGTLFAVEGALLVYAAITHRGRRFQWPPGWGGRIAGALAIYALLVYPLMGLALGHSAEELPPFGLAPCPTTLFTVAVLAGADGATRRLLLPVPLLWAAIGTSAAFLFGVWQDLGLIAALALGLWSLATSCGVMLFDRETGRDTNA